MVTGYSGGWSQAMVKHGYRLVEDNHRLQWRIVTGYGEAWLQATVEDGHRLQWRIVTGYGEAWLQATVEDGHRLW